MIFLFSTDQCFLGESFIAEAMLLEIAVAIVVCLVGFVYASIKPPPPKICGSPGGPPVTSPRIRLKDGRHVAYLLRGVPLEKAKHKVVVCHGYRDVKDMVFIYSQVTCHFLILRIEQYKFYFNFSFVF